MIFYKVEKTRDTQTTEFDKIKMSLGWTYGLNMTKRGVMNLQEKSALQPPQASASFLLCQSTWHYP